MRSLNAMAVLTLICSLAGCERYSLDWQKNDLCKVDGGIVVYEAVSLPASRFDRTGNLIPHTPFREGMNLGEHLAGPDYAIEYSSEAIVAGDPFKDTVAKGRLLRFVTLVRRVSDRKVLAREVSYGRTGGDISLGQPSQNYCPKPRPEPNLVLSTFRRGG
jgi:hypothetical protein